MADILLNSNYEIDRSSGFTKLTSKADENLLTQRINLKLNEYYQEYFLDQSQGIPYKEKIFRKGYNLEEIKRIMINKMINTPDVSKVLNYEQSVNKETNKLTISYTIVSIDSEVINGDLTI